MLAAKKSWFNRNQHKLLQFENIGVLEKPPGSLVACSRGYAAFDAGSAAAHDRGVRAVAWGCGCGG